MICLPSQSCMGCWQWESCNLTHYNYYYTVTALILNHKSTLRTTILHNEPDVVGMLVLANQKIKTT